MFSPVVPSANMIKKNDGQTEENDSCTYLA